MGRHDISPLNTFWRLYQIDTISSVDGSETGATTGSVTGFIATSNAPDATAADATLSVAGTHVGVASPAAGQWPLGTWLISIPGSSLTVALMDQLFNNNSTLPYLIIERTGSDRVSETLKYKRTKKATT